MLAAEAQPGAYGRNGRRWEAPAGQGLYLTLVRRAEAGEPLSVVPIAVARWAREVLVARDRGRRSRSSGPTISTSASRKLGGRDRGVAHAGRGDVRRDRDRHQREGKAADARRGRTPRRSSRRPASRSVCAPLLQALLDRFDRELAAPRWDEEVRAWELASLHRPGDRLTIRRNGEEITGAVRRPGSVRLPAPAPRSGGGDRRLRGGRRHGERAGGAAKPCSPSTSATRTPCSGSGAASELVRHWRLTTRREATADEIALSVRGLLADGPSRQAWRPRRRQAGAMRVIVASVVPSLQVLAASRRCGRCSGASPCSSSRGSRPGCRSCTRSRRRSARTGSSTPSRRSTRVGGPCIVVDFGTATTFDVVTAKGEYAGGVIVPGIAISAEALFEKAARLWRVEIRRPESVVGKTTAGSIQSGLYFGYL